MESPFFLWCMFTFSPLNIRLASCDLLQNVTLDFCLLQRVITMDLCNVMFI